MISVLAYGRISTGQAIADDAYSVRAKELRLFLNYEVYRPKTAEFNVGCLNAYLSWLSPVQIGSDYPSNLGLFDVCIGPWKYVNYVSTQLISYLIQRVAIVEHYFGAYPFPNSALTVLADNIPTFQLSV